MAVQDPTVAEAQFAFEQAELIDGGPAVSWGAILAGAFSAAALWGAIAMLSGAFCAALAATWGGRARDL